jgi:carbon-monoxide dehydrogenase small subunit
MIVTLDINDEAREVDVQTGDTLLEILRERLGLLGAKRGCNQGVCGACTVLIDGQPMRGCLSLAVNCTGRRITTIEGLADGGALAPVQQAFVDSGAVQCGFCIPGMLLTAHALLAETPNPSVEEVRAGLAGNLCRCSGYVKLIDAVRLAAAEGRAG